MTRAITGLQAIFDEGLMKRTFEDYLLPFCGGGTVIRECRRGWSKYRPDKGTSQAVYHVDFADPNEGEHFRRLLYLIVPGESRMEPGMPEKGEPDGKDLSWRHGLQLSYLYVRELDLLIQAFPADMRLPQLTTLVEPGAMARYLWAAADQKEVEIHSIRVLKYKPEKRCVIRYDLAGQVETPAFERGSSLVGKTYSDDRGREVFQVGQFLRSSGVPIPEPLSYVPELKLLLIEALRGRELGSLVGEPDFPVYLKAAAGTVAGLHMVTVGGNAAASVSLEEEAEHFARLVERFQQECPSLRTWVARLAGVILRELKTSRREVLTFVHGELDPSQLIVDDSQMWFVDLDLFRISHPATDVGRFLAYLNRSSLARYGDPSRLDPMVKLFLDAYLSCGPADDLERVILICQAMECVKISFIHFRRQEADWKIRLTRMWEMAERVLSSA